MTSFISDLHQLYCGTGNMRGSAWFPRTTEKKCRSEEVAKGSIDRHLNLLLQGIERWRKSSKRRRKKQDWVKKLI